MVAAPKKFCGAATIGSGRCEQMHLLRSRFLGAEGAAMGAVAADFGAREHHFKSELRFDLLAHFL
jgi:hypothetical protein